METDCQAGTPLGRADRLVWLIPLLFFFFLLSLRPLLAKSLEHDEAEQVLFAEKLSWGFNHQPPLYSWLCWTAFQFTGVRLYALTAIKACLIAGALLVLTRILLRLGAKPVVAATAALAVFLCPFLAGVGLTRLTHTHLVSLMYVVTILQVIRLQANPTLAQYALLGVCTGLGMLSKYNYGLYLVALAAAAWTVPEMRRRLLDWRMFVAVAIGFLILVPHGVWLESHREHVVDKLDNHLEFGALPWLHGVLLTAPAWLGSVASVLGPLFVGYWLLTPATERKLFRPLWQDAFLLIWLERAFLITVLAFLSAVLLSVANFRTHWLGPAAYLTPIIVFGRLTANGAEVPHRRWLATIVAVLLVCTAIHLAGPWRANGPHQRDAMIDAMCRIAGQHPDRPVVVSSIMLAGNLRYHCPDQKVVCLESTETAKMDDAAGHLAMWKVTKTTKPPSWLRPKTRAAADELFISVEQLNSPLPEPGTRYGRIGLIRDIPADVEATRFRHTSNESE